VSLILKEDVEYNDIVIAAYELCEWVIGKYSLKKHEDFVCPYFRALSKELYREEEDADG